MINTIKDILKKSWSVYKNNFAKIAVAILAVWLPLVLIQALIVDPSLDLEGLNEILSNPELLGTAEYENAALASYRSMSIYMIMTLIISFLGIVSDITIIKIAAASHKNELKKTESSFSDFFSEAIPILPRSIWTLILTSLLIAGGLMLFILPGIYVYVMSALAMTATVLIGSRGLNSIKISFAVIKKEIFTVALVMLFFIVLNSIIGFAFDLISVPLPDNKIITSVLDAVITLAGKFVTAVQLIFFAIFFIERTEVINSEHVQGKAPEAEL
ncbi:MAG: hypothetical protein IJZ94_05730 [Clostridia bacterium]|nr:hypothetical protein [Clostridia bacterium]